MKVKNKGKRITLREVDFPKGKVVNLADNPGLFDKVKNIPQFEVVSDGDGV